MARLAPVIALPDGGSTLYFDTVGPPTSSTGGGDYHAGDMLCILGSTKGLPLMYRCTVGGNPGTWELVAAGQGAGIPVTVLSGSTDAIPPHTGATYVITTAGVDAMTLAAPTAGAPSAGGDDGKRIRISSTTANAHTLTATGLLQTGTASVNVATFAAQAGAGLDLMAYNAKWVVMSSVGITFS